HGEDSARDRREGRRCQRCEGGRVQCAWAGHPTLRSRYQSNVRPLHECGVGELISNRDLLQLDCTVLVPAALSEQITEQNAGWLRCRILAEAANGPTTLGADRILEEKGIFVIPDILANSGGVIVSY